MQLLLLLVGLAMIIKSADVLINSVSNIARRYGISSFIIGITVIAFGTSAPELAVGIISGLNRTNQLTLGNIIGSSLSNIALIVGLAAVIFPLRVKDTVVQREMPMLLMVEIILGAMLFGDGRLSRFEGVILLGAFGLFLVYIWRDARNSVNIPINAESDINAGDGPGLPQESNRDQKNSGLLKLSCYSVLSLLGLFIGGRITVDSSTQIALRLELSETLIGLTVVALATTMPELITSIMAVLKKEPDIVLGNCIGSNICNMLLVLGLSSVISPIAAEKGLGIDVAAMILITLLVWMMLMIKKELPRLSGIFLLTSYIAYLSFKVISVLVS